LVVGGSARAKLAKFGEAFGSESKRAGSAVETARNPCNGLAADAKSNAGSVHTIAEGVPPHRLSDLVFRRFEHARILPPDRAHVFSGENQFLR
jgi:hypothetical protein